MKQLKLFLILSTLPLAACNSESADAPVGQVVATIDGQEITAAELKMEMGNAAANNPGLQKQIEQAALQSIVNRYILAKAATDAKVDNSPAAAMARKKAEQLATIQLLENQIRAAVPQPTKEEAEQFVNDNPASFIQRRIFLVDQKVIESPPASLLKALEPLETMAQVDAELARLNITANSTLGVIDALTIDARAAKQIADLGPDAVFVTPENNTIRINRIRDTQIVPVTGADAINVALQTLREQRVQAQVSNQMSLYIQKGMKNVKYNTQFAPPKVKPKAPAPAS